MSFVWPLVQQDHQLLAYFPKRSLLDAKRPNRNYFWAVMQTLRSDFCDALISEAQEKRAAGLVRRVPQANSILNVGITKDWCRKLLEHPYVSR